MPPVLLAAAGLLGAAALARLIGRESRRVSAALDAHRKAHPATPEAPEEPGVRLVRDPVTGAYRPASDG